MLSKFFSLLTHLYPDLSNFYLFRIDFQKKIYLQNFFNAIFLVVSIIYFIFSGLRLSQLSLFVSRRLPNFLFYLNRIFLIFFFYKLETLHIVSFNPTCLEKHRIPQRREINFGIFPVFLFRISQGLVDIVDNDQDLSSFFLMKQPFQRRVVYSIFKRTSSFFGDAVRPSICCGIEHL